MGSGSQITDLGNKGVSSVSHSVHRTDEAEAISGEEESRGGSDKEELPEDLKTLKDENKELKEEIPAEILDNLPPEMKAMLLQNVVQAREEIVQKEFHDRKEEKEEEQ